MKWVLMICLLACVGCVTTVETRWNNRPAPVVPQADNAELNNIKAGITRMVKELAGTPNEIEAVNAVLRKYGIDRE